MDTLVMDTPLAQLREILAQQQGLIVALRAENARLRAENGVLRELVAQLQERIAELEAKLGPPSGKGTPDFVKASRKKAKKEGPLRWRSENFARKREGWTKRILHAIEQYTECGCRLLGRSLIHILRCRRS